VPVFYLLNNVNDAKRISMDLRSFLSRVGQKSSSDVEEDGLLSASNSGSDSDGEPIVSIRKKKDRALLPAFRRLSNEEAKGTIVSLLPTNTGYGKSAPHAKASVDLPLLCSAAQRSTKSVFVAAALRQKRRREPDDDELDLVPQVDVAAGKGTVEVGLAATSYISDSKPTVFLADLATAERDDDDFYARTQTVTHTATEQPLAPQSNDLAEVPLIAEVPPKAAVRRRGLLELAKSVAKEGATLPLSKSWMPESKTFQAAGSQ
jgi:hypothetical protein